MNLFYVYLISEEICQRKRQKPLSQPAKTKLQDKKNQKRTLNEKRKIQSGTNHAVHPEEGIGRGTNIAPKAEIGTRVKRQMLMLKRRKLAAGARARAKKKRERRKSVIKQMTNEDAQAARTGKRKTKMPKSERRKVNKKTEAKKPNNSWMEMKRRNRRRWKRRRMESSDVTDQEAEKRVAMHRGGPGRGAAASVANHVTEAVTGVTAAAGTEDHLAGRGAENETEVGIGGEMRKTETRGRAQKPEDETGAPKNALPRKSEAESETIDRAVGRGKKRATAEAAILRVMAINGRKEKGARAQNQKRGQRTNLKVQEKMQRKRMPLPVTVIERLHVPLQFFSFLFPTQTSTVCCSTNNTKRLTF